MKCPYCGCTKTKVIDTRPLSSENIRTRVCKECKRSFDTKENYFPK